MKLGFTAFLLMAPLAFGCEQVGSDAWCEKLDGTPKTEWSFEDAGNYAKHCVLDMDSVCEKLEKKPKSEWTVEEVGEYAKSCAGRTK